MENIVIEGRLIQKLPVQEGESTRGAWKKQDFIVETTAQYPKKICIACWGDKVDELQSFAENAMIKASVNIESREYNSRWYTDIKAWRLETMQEGEQKASPAETNAVEDITGMSFSEEDDTLPF